MRILVILSLVTIMAGCGQRKVVSTEDFVKTVETPAVETASTPAKWAWSYQGERGPEQWASLNPEYSMCSSGKAQSPVNLKWSAPLSPSPLKIMFRPTDAVVSNTGTTFRLEFTPQSQIIANGQEYILEKAEFRSPSEHRLSGKKLPIEIQFYHRSPNGLRQAILSMFVVKGKESTWFDGFLNTAIQTPVNRSSASQRMALEKLIPSQQTFYHYQGSLTHPPCLEGVDWFVLNTPIQLSARQIAGLKALYQNNNRPLQKLNGRSIKNH